jgi:uncharacterized Ntn-hydrolase superfamily protein
MTDAHRTKGRLVGLLPRLAIAAPALWVSGSGPAAQAAAAGGAPPSSYAILARDPLTGEYGVAAASHAPLIGMNLEYLDIEAGGVVVLGGPYLEINEKALVALRDGLAPDRAIAVALAGDLDRERRQVLVLSPAGAAAFTGKKLPGHAAHETGEYFVAAGHRLNDEGVVAAMAQAFAESDGPLADRLLGALRAGKAAGGEEGGEHSAALLVVGPGARFATRDRLVDLRIDFVPDDAVAALADLRARIDSVYGIK